MKRLACLVAGASTLLLSGVAMAQGATAGAPAPADDGGGGGGFALGARLGYGLPMGEAVKDGDLSDGFSNQIPLWLDVGYFVTPNIMVGLYGSYGLASVADDACPDQADCSGSVLRFGLQGQYHLSPAESLDPWFGLGIGMETAKYSAEAGGQEASTSYSGLEFLMLQGGANFEVGDGIGVGPFAALTVAQYSSFETDVPGVGKQDGDIEDKGMHQWLIIGVAGMFSL